MLAALLLVLAVKAAPAVRHFGFGFLVGSEWRPNEIERPKRDAAGKIVMEDGETVMETVPEAFGAFPVIYGTLVSTGIALVFAVPLSLGAAMFLVRIAHVRLVTPVSFLVEFLAAIPSLAYGIWGLFVLGPFLQNVLEPALQRSIGQVPGFQWLFTYTLENGKRAPLSPTGRDMFAGGLILSIMILPIITAISRDVLRAVPRRRWRGRPRWARPGGRAAWRC